MKGFDASFRHAAALRDLVEQGFFDPDKKEENLKKMRELSERYRREFEALEAKQKDNHGTA